MARDFDYGTLTFERREEIHDALAATTVKHINRDLDLFSPMPFDMAQSPSQRLEMVHLSPAPSTLQEVHDLADIANRPLAEAVREKLKGERAYLSTVRRLMDKWAENLACVTTHLKIDDVALWQSGWVEEIEQEDWQDRNGLGISRGVTTIQAFDMAASEVVQKMGHVFLSFPRTETIDGLDIEPDLIDTNNRRMREAAKSWMGPGYFRRLRGAQGNALHIGWEGRTPLISYGDNQLPESVVLGKISNGTIKLLKKAVVQPIVICEDPDPVVILGELTEVKSRRDAERVQNWQREILADVFGISPDQIAIAA